MHPPLIGEALSSPAPASITHFWLFGLIMLAMLAFYGWLALRSSTHAVLSTQPFGLPDAICSGILAVWMVSVICQSINSPQVITPQAITANSIVYFSLVLGIFGVIGFQGLSAPDLFHLQPSHFPKAAITGLFWLLITYPLIMAVQMAVQSISHTGDDSQLIVRYFLEHPDPRQRAAVIFMALVVAPVAEEVIFRGYFYGVIRRYGGRIPALLTSSLLFAAIHVHLPSLPGLGILAIILCLLYERTGSLWAPIAMHSAFNASTIVALILWPEAVS